MDGSNTATMAASLTDARAELVRGRILQGVADVLGRGEAWTFASVAKAAAVPERTIYRYFPTREALLGAIFDWSNQRIGFQGQLPTNAAELTALARRSFPGFDELAPVVRELLLAPEGRLARLRQKPLRQRTSLALAKREAPRLDAKDTRRLAAVLQLLTQAATWQALRDYWDMDGAEAAETAALAIDLLLTGARTTGRKVKNTKLNKRPRRAKEPT
jgi:AcrR family transcriptional regulator